LKRSLAGGLHFIRLRARIREGVDQWRDAGITTPVLVPLSPDGSQLNGLKAVFTAFER